MEEYALGAMLSDPEAATLGLAQLAPAAFSRDRHRAIFDAIAHCVGRGVVAEPVAVTRILETMGKLEDVGGQITLLRLADVCPTAANMPFYVSEVQLAQLRRDTWRLGMTLARRTHEPGAAPDELLERTADELTQLRQHTTPLPSRWPFPLVDELQLMGNGVTWTVERLLARQRKTSLTGLGKGGKTTLTTHMLRALRHGETFCGRALTPGPVIVVSEETPDAWIDRRDRYHLDGGFLRVQCKPFVAKPSPPDWHAFVLALARQTEATGTALVVLDALPNLWSCDDENDAAVVLEALRPLDAVTDAGAALLLVMHPTKSDQTEGRAIRGSGAIGGFVDILAELRRYRPDDPKDRRRVLTWYSRLSDQGSEVLFWDGDPQHEYVAQGEAEAPDPHESARTRMLQMLANGPCTTKNLALACGIGAAKADHVLRTMLDRVEQTELPNPHAGTRNQRSTLRFWRLRSELEEPPS